MVNLNNAHVKITDRDGGWIKLSPFEAQAEPVHLARLKTEISQRWPMISLLDILKEADLRVHSPTTVRRLPAIRVSIRPSCKNDCCCASMAWERTSA